MSEQPQLLAWITCDAIHSDPATGKYTLLGVFSSLRARSFPVTHPRMIWFLALTSVPTGEHQLDIFMGLPIEGNRQKVVERSFQSPGPLHRINLINEIKNLEFEQADDYSVEIEIDGETFLITKFNVSEST